MADYTWRQLDIRTNMFCRSKMCARLHYKYGQPKQMLVYLKIDPPRESYINEILFCPRCKQIKISNW